MGLDFDALEYCKNIKQNQPPYSCPVSKCDRSYKTIVGLQYHLLKYDHDNPQPLTPIITPNRKKARSRGSHHSTPKASKISGIADGHDGSSGSSKHVLNPESLVTFNEDEQTVQFNIDGKSVRLAIEEPLPIIDDDEYEVLVNRGCILNADALPLEENASWARVKVPEPQFRIIEDYNVPDAPPRPLAYYRFIEKSAEELDGEIEYDVDEEDSAWLEWMNGERDNASLNPVSIDTMELLMDRLEKESYFQAAANGTTTGVEVDDDAVCCICMDGECQNTNVILFCDMCNLAVHQDCYGVPYIPEGQWLCRRCLQSPSTPVNCVLCPNTGGAFKQTDRGQWAHVVCALWIPEVRFANTVFLEPIDSIETIPPARWRLTCYVCKEKGLGACIQCHRNSCYAAFHVTCAQQAGLYMTMDTVNDGHNDSSVHVQKYAYCHAHTPPDAKLKTNQKEVEDTRHKMKEARKALAKKRSTAPVVLIPTIPPDRIQEIASMVHMQKKKEFLDRLIAYWTLKRFYRNGVPLLRRLQSQGNNHSVIQRNGIEGSPDTVELYKQLKYWQCLRQDLERARLLCELVRKREKLKVAYVKICEQVVMLQLNPLDSALTKLLDALESKDTSEIFREPVDTTEVPDYLDIVKVPMDLGTMREKLKSGQYTTLEYMENDFDLMIQNCLAYNNKDTVFYRAGLRMRDQGAALFQQVRKELEREGLVDQNNSGQHDHVEQEVEDELKVLLAAPACEEIVQKLLILADKSQVLKNPSYRTKKIKQIRLEITRMRKAIQKSKMAARKPNFDTHSHTHNEIELDRSVENVAEKKKKAAKRMRKLLNTESINNTLVDEDDLMGEEESKEQTIVQTPPCSPIKSIVNSASPVGVNRRTAVLFTRKAQAALKRPYNDTTTPVKEESSSSLPSVNATTSTATTTTTTTTPLNNSTNNNNNNNNNNINTSQTSLINNKINNINSGNLLSPIASSFTGTITGSAVVGAKSPKRNSRHKRLADIRQNVSLSPKKSPNALYTTTTITTTTTTTTTITTTTTTPSASASASATTTGGSLSALTSATTTGGSTSASAVANPLKSIPSDVSNDRSRNFISESFRVYRANNERDATDSDEDDLSDISCSSCSGFSDSGGSDSGSGCSAGSVSEYGSSDDDDDDNDTEGGGGGGRGGGGDGVENSKNCAVNNNDENDDMNESDDGEHERDGDGEGDDDDDDDNNMDVDNSKSENSRTPTPLEKRAHNKGRAKQKSKTINAGRTRATSVSLNNNNKKIVNTRSSTPASNNNIKATKKQLNNNRTKLNNAHSENDTGAISSSPVSTASTTTHNPEAVNAVNNNETSPINSNSTNALLKPPLEPLQLVWAKCRGYPWYPALILDPKTPKGFVYNGVPLPAPPPDVLALRKNYTEDFVFLVLFFDAKRTWQWLPENKLEILGINKQLDQQKLIESRKPTERKAVKKAYQDALHYQSQVSDLEGQGPDPIM